MPLFYLRLRHPSAQGSSEAREFPDLGTALIEANHRVCGILARLAPKGKKVRGSLDIEDEEHRPVARVLLADVQHQIS